MSAGGVGERREEVMFRLVLLVICGLRGNSFSCS